MEISLPGEEPERHETDRTREYSQWLARERQAREALAFCLLQKGTLLERILREIFQECFKEGGASEEKYSAAESQQFALQGLRLLQSLLLRERIEPLTLNISCLTEKKGPVRQALEELVTIAKISKLEAGVSERIAGGKCSFILTIQIPPEKI
ncbi:MAG: hypothetical protein Q8P95_05370 [bacterium]|nr:hypothetical protein [bacterium]